MKPFLYLATITIAVVSALLLLSCSDTKDLRKTNDLTIVEIGSDTEPNAYLLAGRLVTKNNIFRPITKPIHIAHYSLTELNIETEKHDYILADIELSESVEQSIICFPDEFYIVSEQDIGNCEPFLVDQGRLILSDGSYRFGDHALDLWSEWSYHISDSTNYVEPIIEDFEGGRLESDLDYIRAAYDWVQKNLVFTYELSDHSPTPDIKNIIKDQHTDCKGFSAVLATLLKAGGIDSQLILVKTQAENSAANGYLLSGFDHTLLYLPEFDMYLDPTLTDSLPGEYHVTEDHYYGYNLSVGSMVDLTDHMRQAFFLQQDATIYENDDEIIFEIHVESFGQPISTLDLSQLEDSLGRYLEIYTKTPKNFINTINYEYTEGSTRQLSLEYSIPTDAFLRYHDRDSLMPTFNGFGDVEIDRCFELRRVSISLENYTDTLELPTGIERYEEYFLVEPTPNGLILNAPTGSADFTCNLAMEYGSRRDELIFDLYSPKPE